MIPNTFVTFPIYPMEDGLCTCDRPNCRDHGKHPMVTGWQKEDFQSIPPKPGQGYGIVTGKRSGVFVVDLDGVEAIKHFQSLGPSPRTRIVRTGREEPAAHVHYSCPEGFEVRNDQGRKLGHPKIDIRGEGGFVVGEGSPHKSGRTYTILDDSPIAPAPDWLLARLSMDPQERRVAAASAPKPVDPDSDTGKYRIEVAFDYLTEEAEPAVQGSNGSGALWYVAQKLVRTLQLPLDVSMELIKEIYNTRCSPPWADWEIWHKLENARDVGTWDCGYPSEGWLVGEDGGPGRLFLAAQAPTKYPSTGGSPSTRRTPNHSHSYSFSPGDMPNGEKKKITFATATAILVGHAEWNGVLQYDEFRKRFYAVDPPTRMDAERGGLSDEDGYAIAAWFEVNNMYMIGGDMAYKAAVQAARRNTYHPVKEYLASVGEAKTGILDTLASRALGAKDPMANEYLKKTLVAAVRRVRSPGCQMDTVLVLVGTQGIRKTTFVRRLFGEEFVRSQMPELGTKDASQALNGYWAIELAELSRILNTPSSTVKEFLTRTFDDYRPPYGRTDMRFPRQCVLIGTTNDMDFLSDATGNRRYLPVLCEKIDIDYIEAHRSEIWAEACALETAGYQHWYEDESQVEASRAPFVQEDPWQPAIATYLKGKQFVTNQDIYRAVIMGDMDKYDRKTQMRIADTLKRLGCVSIKKTGGVRMWDIPSVLAKPATKEVDKTVS